MQQNQNKRGMERDSKGRFVKGNTSGISTEVAREYQRRSAKKRKENKTIADTLRAALEERVSSTSPLTKREFLILKALSNASKDDSLSFRDIKDLQALLGESVQNVNVTGDPKIMEMSKEAIEALGRWSGKAKE